MARARAVRFAAFVVMAALALAMSAAGCSNPRSTRSGSGPVVAADGGTEDPPPEESCLGAMCGSELDACAPGCAALLDCATSCETEDCVDGCVSRATESDLQQASAILDCYDANCSAGGSGGGGGGGGGGATTAEINHCIDGITSLCTCAALADSPCTDSDIDNYYDGCLAGYSNEGFPILSCLADYAPRSLGSCSSAFDACFPD